MNYTKILNIENKTYCCKYKGIVNPDRMYNVNPDFLPRIQEGENNIFPANFQQRAQQVVEEVYVPEGRGRSKFADEDPFLKIKSDLDPVKK